jgi:VWFA-related protein
VDLIVTDSKGRHVSDLQAKDFQLLEDGKPRQITNFSWTEVTPPASGARLAALNEKPSLFEKWSGLARFRKTPGNNILSAPVANLRKEEIRRVIAIVVAGGMGPGDTEAKMKRVRKFIDEQVGPGDMVSIRSTLRLATPMPDGRTVGIRDALGILQQFTNDKRQLDAATEQIPWIFLRRRGRQLFEDVVGTLTRTIRDLQDLPGRKALLFVGRYRGPVDSIISLANRAGVVIYVIDPSGFQGPDDSPLVRDDLPSLKAARRLAERTGGRRIVSTVGFDLTRGFNEVIEDLSGYYLLGYHTTAYESGSTSKTRVSPKIEVKVLREGLTVRVRDSSMMAPDPAAQPESRPAAQPTGREETLTKALFTIFTQDGVRLHLNPLFAASQPDPKKKRTPLVRTLLQIDGRDLAFTESGGKMHAVLDLVVAVFNEDGSQAGAANRRITLQLAKERVPEVARAGLQYKLDVALTKPGWYQVRAAVRDATSGEIGSSYAFLDIPDFNRSRVSLSSIVLGLAEGTPAPPAARLGWNEVAPGMAVNYVCEIFGLQPPGKPPAPPNVEVEVELYRGGGPVAKMPRSPAKVEEIGGRLFLTGSMRIPDDLAAGNYAMELRAYDRLEPSAKKRAAQQWSDLTVVGPAAK